MAVSTDATSTTVCRCRAHRTADPAAPDRICAGQETVPTGPSGRQRDRAARHRAGLPNWLLSAGSSSKSSAAGVTTRPRPCMMPNNPTRTLCHGASDRSSASVRKAFARGRCRSSKTSRTPSPGICRHSSPAVSETVVPLRRTADTRSCAPGPLPSTSTSLRSDAAMCPTGSGDSVGAIGSARWKIEPTPSSLSTQTRPCIN